VTAPDNYIADAVADYNKALADDQAHRGWPANRNIDPVGTMPGTPIGDKDPPPPPGKGKGKK
jgi:hypothetical protein